MKKNDCNTPNEINFTQKIKKKKLVKKSWFTSKDVPTIMRTHKNSYKILEIRWKSFEEYVGHEYYLVKSWNSIKTVVRDPKNFGVQCFEWSEEEKRWMGTITHAHAHGKKINSCAVRNH